MKAIRSIAVLGLSIFASPLLAQAVKSEVAASNGVVISVYSDEFANRYEYSAPAVKAGDANAYVATIKKVGVAPSPHITGFIMYNGEWRRYSSAIYKGGDQAKFASIGKEVGRCYSSRYSRPSCTLTESFRIDVSADDIQKHAENGILAIQLRADDTSTVILSIPVAYFDAIREVSKK